MVCNAHEMRYDAYNSLASDVSALLTPSAPYGAVSAISVGSAAMLVGFAAIEGSYAAIGGSFAAAN